MTRDGQHEKSKENYKTEELHARDSMKLRALFRRHCTNIDAARTV
jgi:hypothetical protein